MADRLRENADGGSRVFIVDDHPVVRQGLAQLVEQERDLAVCGESGMAHEALNAIRKLKPDIVVLDISLGDGNGISLIKDIGIHCGPVPVLVLSMHDETLFAERALRAGARGYIMKEEATDKVLEAIRKVLRNEVYLSPNMATRLLDKMLHNHHRDEAVASPVANLSNREIEVFELVGFGMRPQAIAARLGISVKTVDAHRANLKRKLRLRNAIELLQYATQWVQAEKSGK